MKSLQLGAFLLAISSLAMGQTYTNIADDQGMNVYSPQTLFGAGASFFDFNNDGWDDITFTTNQQAVQFFRNDQGTFTEIAFPAIQSIGESKQALWVDFDNDGDSDLFVTYREERIRLFENTGDLQLVDISDQAGLNNDPEIYHWGACFGDYNRDGFLDLYVCKFTNSGDIAEAPELENDLYRNNGDGTFTEVTHEAGVGNGIGLSFQSAFIDYNNDNWPDLLVTNDEAYENALYENNRDGTFTDVSEATGMDAVMDAMCIALGDYDNDLDMDIFISNNPTNTDGVGNILFVNEGGSYSRLGPEYGIGVGMTCWGSQWMDYDNNGVLDLWNTANFGPYEQLNPFFVNEGNNVFTQSNVFLGLDGNDEQGYGLAQGDANNDGYPDIAQNSAHPHTADVYVSSGGNNHWLKVRLEGVASNRDAIGAKVTLYSGGEAQLRHRFCGESYLSQSSASLFFGLSEALQADSIQITWPSGLEEKHYNVPADQSVLFVEGTSLTVDIIAEAEVACPNTPITFASSVQGNTYFWNGEEGDSTLTVTEPGVYTLEVIHPLGFELTSEAQEFTWFPETEAEVNAIDPSCFGGSNGIIEISSEQGINQVVWSGIEGNEALVEGLPAGTYSAAIYDGNDCTSFENVTLEEGIVLEGELEVTDAILDGALGLATVNMINGQAPYTYDWSTGCSNLACPNLEGGNYSITITDSNGCSWSSEFEVEVLVNIAEAKKEEILAFPNPFKDQIHVQIQHASIMTLEVLNSLGQVVFDGQMTANSLDLDTSAWPSGTYALIVRNGDQVYKRILIKH